MNGFEIDLETALQSAPIVYIPHFDYDMIDEELERILCRIGLGTDSIAEYDNNRGVVDFSGKMPKKGNEFAMYKQLDVWLECIVDAVNTDTERVFLFKNLQQDVLDNYKIQLLLQTFAAKYKHGNYSDKGKVYSVVIVSPMPVSALSSNIEKVFTMIEYPMPTSEDIGKLLSELSVAESVIRRGKSREQFLEELTYTLLGLHSYEVHQILRTLQIRSYKGQLNNNSIEYALQEKQRIVKKSGIIEVIEADTDFDEVGGLDRLKTDLSKKALLYQNLNEIQNKTGFNLPIDRKSVV